jgi:hypothetical protein
MPSLEAWGGACVEAIQIRAREVAMSIAMLWGRTLFPDLG